MDYGMWEPFYRKILDDFGFSRERDEAVADELDRLLGGRRAGEAELRSLLRGKEVTVAGNGPNVAAEISKSRGLLITADEATSVAWAKGLRPSILVTDLDGDVADQVRANLEGAIAVVHGHGDNGPAVRKWASGFRGVTMGTTQSRPRGGLRNFGGFTDGDRAVFLADHFGAKAIRLVGFDFRHPNEKDRDRATKQRKLDWAYILLGSLHRDELGL
jgi:hypothetical protein